MKRSEGERVRLHHALARMRGTLDSVKTALKMSTPFGPEVAQAVMQGAFEVACQLTRHDAFLIEEEDAEPTKAVAEGTFACDTCKDTHLMTMHSGSGDEQIVMCTRCPVPCQECRAPLGAFCAVAKCPCPCHARWRK